MSVQFLFLSTNLNRKNVCNLNVVLSSQLINQLFLNKMFLPFFRVIMTLDNSSQYEWGPPDICRHGLILPIFDERSWNVTFRAIVYLLAMFYFFLGVAIVTDIFMSSIEVITSTTRKIYLAKTRSKKVTFSSN